MDHVLPQFPIEKYQMSELIGQGGQGSVISYKICRQESTLPNEVAVKVFQPKHEGSFIKEKENIEAVMVNDHPNIVKCLGICQPTGDKQALVFEVFDCDLMDYMCNKGTACSNAKSRNILYQIAKALEHMHRVKHVHRDVKPDNVLVKVLEDDQMKV